MPPSHNTGSILETVGGHNPCEGFESPGNAPRSGRGSWGVGTMPTMKPPARVVAGVVVMLVPLAVVQDIDRLMAVAWAAP